jgi:hypothetical protein
MMEHMVFLTHKIGFDIGNDGPGEVNLSDVFDQQI